ncbi:hypothetical protein F4802DRAFT_561635 [Xylaria palmicola]|nr:hypothetical protein F4802DRAFT_561635 [Xylaria palmicola]
MRTAQRARPSSACSTALLGFFDAVAFALDTLSRGLVVIANKEARGLLKKIQASTRFHSSFVDCRGRRRRTMGGDSSDPITGKFPRTVSAGKARRPREFAHR